MNIICYPFELVDTVDRFPLYCISLFVLLHCLSIVSAPLKRAGDIIHNSAKNSGQDSDTEPEAIASDHTEPQATASDEKLEEIHMIPTDVINPIQAYCPIFYPFYHI